MEVRYLHLRPELIAPDFTARPFGAVIVAERKVTEDWRRQIAAWIVESGCLFAVAWGVDCEAWHDSVDWANLELFDFGDIPDEGLVMTTWHDGEPLTEAFWFAGNCAFHPVFDLAETIILHVADEARADIILRAYHDSQAMDDA